VTLPKQRNPVTAARRAPTVVGFKARIAGDVCFRSAAKLVSVSGMKAQNGRNWRSAYRARKCRFGVLDLEEVIR